MKILYYNQCKVPCSLSNIKLKKGYCTVDLYDVIEDATDSSEMAEAINNITDYQKFSVDRETDKYIRLINVDPLGNRNYLEISKES